MAKDLALPALDPETIAGRTGTSYPEPFKDKVAPREKRALGNAAGLTSFGVNLVTMPPGAWSAQRHWHTAEDEFVYILSGEATLVTDAGEQVLGPGMAAGFPAGREDGHHLVNRSDAPVVYLEFGDCRPEDQCHYPDIDLFLGRRDGTAVFTNKKGEPYE